MSAYFTTHPIRWNGSHEPPDEPRRRRRTKSSVAQCMECERKFYTQAAAHRASFSDHGCPDCGGNDIGMAEIK